MNVFWPHNNLLLGGIQDLYKVLSTHLCIELVECVESYRAGVNSEIKSSDSKYVGWNFAEK